MVQLADRGVQPATLLGERVGNAGASAVSVLDGALDQALGLELAQALRQQAIRQPGYREGELGEVVRALGERPQDRAGPALADQLHGGVEVGTDAWSRLG